tara:strand:+ start:2159 stop:2572 length:414 start_codon:yes stop_codon:yes gene_type:complete
MPREYPRDPLKISSPSDKNAAIIYWVGRYDDERRRRTANESILRDRTKEVRGTQADLKKAKGEIVTLTKKEHAKSKEKSSAAYASTAATTLIITYQVVEVSGGWGKWAPVFEHEATVGVIQVAIGSLLAWAMRPLQH